VNWDDHGQDWTVDLTVHWSGPAQWKVAGVYRNTGLDWNMDWSEPWAGVDRMYT